MLFRTLIRPEIRNAPFRWKISLRTCFLLLTVVACVLGIGCLFERAVLGKATGSFLLVIVVPGFYGVLAYKAGGNGTPPLLLSSDSFWRAFSMRIGSLSSGSSTPMNQRMNRGRN